MILDYKLFNMEAKSLKDDLLWVLEQLPNTTEAHDVTDVLRKQSYWSSYNIPYYPDIFNKGGFREMAEKYGDWFTYKGAPRAKIFARNHSMVTDLSSMIALMR